MLSRQRDSVTKEVVVVRRLDLSSIYSVSRGSPIMPHFRILARIIAIHLLFGNRMYNSQIDHSRIPMNVQDKGTKNRVILTFILIFFANLCLLSRNMIIIDDFFIGHLKEMEFALF